MKKYFFLAFGALFFFSGMFLLNSEAQNYVYYKNRSNYCRVSSECNDLPLRTFSDRKASFAYRLPTNYELKYHQLNFDHPSGRANANLYPDYRPATLNYRDQKLLRRISNPELYPRYMNEYATGVNVVRAGNYKVTDGLVLDTAQNVYVYDASTSNNVPRISVTDSTAAVSQSLVADTAFPYYAEKQSHNYTFDVPNGFVKVDDIYRHRGTSLAFRVIESNNTCPQLTFEMCAIDYRKQFVEEQSLMLQSSIKRFTTPRNTVKGSFVQLPGVSESFYAHAYGMDNVYFLLSVFDPSAQKMVHIEAVAQKKDAYNAAIIMERLYQSFQFHL